MYVGLGRGGTWLEVTVKVAVLVDVGQAAQYLEGPFAHLALRHQLRLLLHQLIQIAVLPQPRQSTSFISHALPFFVLAIFVYRPAPCSPSAGTHCNPDTT